MHRFISRVIALLLALLLTAGLFGCGEEEAPSSDTSSVAASSEISPGNSSKSSSGETSEKKEEVRTDPAEILSDLPDYSFGGSAMVIATDLSSPLLSHREMLTSSVSQVYSAIEEKYETFVYVQSYSADTLLEQCRMAVTNGTYFADILAIPLSALPTYLEKGLLMPLTRLPFLHMENAGIDEAATESLTYEGEVYALVGSGTLRELSVTTLLFNRDLLYEMGIETDPTALSQNGEWTWERFLAILSQAKEKLPAGASLIGRTIEADSFTAAIANSFGSAVKEPFDEEMLSAVRELSGLCKTEGSAAVKAFNDGKLLFLMGTVEDLYEFPHSAGIWSCLPLPTATAGEDFRCIYDPDACYVYVVPERTVRSDYTGLYLQAVSASAAGCCRAALRYELLASFVREGSAMFTFDLLLHHTAAEPATALPGFQKRMTALKNAAFPPSVQTSGEVSEKEDA